MELADAKPAAATLAGFFRGANNPGKRALAQAAGTLYLYAASLLPDDPQPLPMWDGNSDREAAVALDKFADGAEPDWRKLVRIAKHAMNLVA